MKYKDFSELPVYKKSHDLVLLIYKETTKFPSSEKFGVISQLRRSAASITANIAEGFYRRTTKDLIKFLYHSRGSCGEVRYFLILSRDLRYLDKDDYHSLMNKCIVIIKQLTSWINSLEAKNIKRT